MTREQEKVEREAFEQYAKKHNIFICSRQFASKKGKELERLNRVEALLNDPVNRARGSVSIQAIREVLR